MIELLYKKKIIRDFLSLFTENHWKPLIACILEYGIIMIQKHHNIAYLTPEDIYQIIEKIKKAENLSNSKKISNSRSVSKDKSVNSSFLSKKPTNLKSNTNSIDRKVRESN